MPQIFDCQMQQVISKSLLSAQSWSCSAVRTTQSPLPCYWSLVGSTFPIILNTCLARIESVTDPQNNLTSSHLPAIDVNTSYKSLILQRDTQNLFYHGSIQGAGHPMNRHPFQCNNSRMVFYYNMINPSMCFGTCIRPSIFMTQKAPTHKKYLSHAKVAGDISTLNSIS